MRLLCRKKLDKADFSVYNPLSENKVGAKPPHPLPIAGAGVNNSLPSESAGV